MTTATLQKLDPAFVLPRGSPMLPADRHPLAVYVASLASEHTKRSATDAARRALALLASRDRNTFGGEALRLFPWQQLRYQHVQAIKARLLDSGVSPGTINVTLSHLRAIVRESWRLGHVGAEEWARVKDVGNVKAETLPAGRALAAGELRAIFEACATDTSTIAARDAALIAVLYAAGVRRSEAAALDLADYTRETGELRVRRGKGRKDRLVYINNGATDALAAWLALRGEAPGSLFHPVTKGGEIMRQHMTPQAVRNACARRAEAAGVKAFSPHDLRRSFVSDLLDAGADVGSVQRLAGHANVATTLRYDRRPEAAKRAAAFKLHVPYTSPVRQHAPKAAPNMRKTLRQRPRPKR